MKFYHIEYPILLLQFHNPNPHQLNIEEKYVRLFITEVGNNTSSTRLHLTRDETKIGSYDEQGKWRRGTAKERERS